MNDPCFSEFIKKLCRNEIEKLEVANERSPALIGDKTYLTTEQISICCNLLAKNNSFIKELRFESCSLTQQDTDSIGLLLKTTSSLNQLIFARCNFPDNAINTIADALTVSTLKVLKIFDCISVDDKNVAYFAKLLKENKFLRSFWVYGSSFTAACTEPFLELLKDNFVISISTSMSQNPPYNDNATTKVLYEIGEISLANHIIQTALEKQPYSVDEQINLVLNHWRGPMNERDRDFNLMRLAQYYEINNLADAYECYLKIPKDSEHFVAANERICAILRLQLDRLDFEEKYVASSNLLAERTQLKELLWKYTNLIAEIDSSRMREAAQLFSELCGAGFQPEPLFNEIKPAHETLCALAAKLREKSIENQKLQAEIKALKEEQEQIALSNRGVSLTYR